MSDIAAHNALDAAISAHWTIVCIRYATSIATPPVTSAMATTDDRRNVGPHRVHSMAFGKGLVLSLIFLGANLIWRGLAAAF